MNKELKFTYINGNEVDCYPMHNFAHHWTFDAKTEQEEALLANCMAKVAEKNGLNTNDLVGMFPLVLRMLKSKSNWAK